MLELAEVNRDFEAEMNLKKKNIDDFLNKSVEYESFNDNKKKPNANYWGNLTQPGSYGPQRLASKSNAMGKEILVLEKKEKPRSPNKEKVKAKPSFRKNLNYAGLFSIKPSSTSLKNYPELTLFEDQFDRCHEYICKRINSKGKFNLWTNNPILVQRRDAFQKDYLNKEYTKGIYKKEWDRISSDGTMYKIFNYYEDY